MFRDSYANQTSRPSFLNTGDTLHTVVSESYSVAEQSDGQRKQVARHALGHRLGCYSRIECVSSCLPHHASHLLNHHLRNPDECAPRQVSAAILIAAACTWESLTLTVYIIIWSGLGLATAIPIFAVAAAVHKVVPVVALVAKSADLVSDVRRGET